MATFKSIYTISELLKLLNRHSLIHYYWTKKSNGEYYFYFVDARRDHLIREDGFIEFITHRSNYYRLRKKILYLPFRLNLDSRSKSGSIYSYLLVPDSVFLNEYSFSKIKQLEKNYGGDYIVHVVVI